MDFSDVKQGLESNAILLIDVRNPEEVRTSGKIPGSHNIPRKLGIS
jgi:3-mercaptopyruvate sulfurtransferase SseA